jgi:hypothetical protein
MAGLEAITTERLRGERLESRHNDLPEAIFGDPRVGATMGGVCRALGPACRQAFPPRARRGKVVEALHVQPLHRRGQVEAREPRQVVRRSPAGGDQASRIVSRTVSPIERN